MAQTQHGSMPTLPASPALVGTVSQPIVSGGLTPPNGFLFLVDTDGAYLVDSDGAYLITPNS